MFTCAPLHVFFLEMKANVASCLYRNDEFDSKQEREHYQRWLGKRKRCYRKMDQKKKVRALQIEHANSEPQTETDEKHEEDDFENFMEERRLDEAEMKLYKRYKPADRATTFSLHMKEALGSKTLGQVVIEQQHNRLLSLFSAGKPISGSWTDIHAAYTVYLTIVWKEDLLRRQFLEDYPKECRDECVRRGKGEMIMYRQHSGRNVHDIFLINVIVDLINAYLYTTEFYFQEPCKRPRHIQLSAEAVAEWWRCIFAPNYGSIQMHNHSTHGRTPIDKDEFYDWLKQEITEDEVKLSSY